MRELLKPMEWTGDLPSFRGGVAAPSFAANSGVLHIRFKPNSQSGFRVEAMRTTLPYLLPFSAASDAHPLSLVRHNAILAISVYLTASAICGLCIYWETTFYLSLLPGVCLLATVYNLIDLTTRLFDQGRKGLGRVLAVVSFGASLSLLPTLFYLFLSWLFVTY